MDTSAVLSTALTVAALVLCVAALYAIVVVVKTVREIRVAVEDIRVRLVPLLDKADVTIDAANAELLRLDAIVTQAEEVGDAVSTASGFIRSPVNTAAQGIARAIRSFGRR
ncbi:MAG: hypothetical protein JW733_05310 [Coriobacteriia bacterium]|nr:hypothetical protein [Coriobacteriia bacterium]MBN2839581.1 hypothetical protein [Coriobacteriia bacterium]